MAALLFNDVLRRHGVSFAAVTARDRIDASAPISRVNQALRARTRPAAFWRLGANGRPICQWAAGDQTSLDLPSG
jgi:hypothetical protein